MRQGAAYAAVFRSPSPFRLHTAEPRRNRRFAARCDGRIPGSRTRPADRPAVLRRHRRPFRRSRCRKGAVQALGAPQVGRARNDSHRGPTRYLTLST